ncbi:MAG: hypothetical protein U9N83_00520 [Thermodesulfobacteriota bacterium]|nr:hypothetical protein [Thermodesulfobacteriota bacterium]
MIKRLTNFTTSLKSDGLVKSQGFAFVVIPSRIGVRDDGQVGIQSIQLVLDAGSSPA